MFRGITKTSFFKVQNHNKFLSIKQLFVLYKLLFKLNKRQHSTNLIQFFINVYTQYNNFNIVFNTITVFYLNVFYLLKTRNIVLLVKYVDNGFNLPKTNTITILKNSKHITFFSKINKFWKKWSKLKKPETNDSFNGFFLNDWKNKITKYTTIGFVKTYNIYIILRYRTENFYKNSITFNKTLLISPKYSSSSINKHVAVSDSKNFEFQFLRKNKVYNKGRYSRCRQNYRTGVYMCMYLSVVSIFGLYYWFYKFSFNFTYLWWLFIAFFGSFFLPKILKYRFYEPNTLFVKFFDFFRWLLLLFKSFF